MYRVWRNKIPFLRDAQKDQTSHPPNPSAPRRALPRARPQQFLLAFKRVAWIGPKPRASREHILIVRTLRGKGTIQATLSILFQHPATEET